MKKLLVLLAMTALWSGGAQAQTVASLQSDLNSLRDDVQMMQRQIYKDDATSTAPQTQKEALMKVGQLDEDVRQMKGRLDELDYKIKQTNDRIDMLNKDIDVRFKMLEGKPIDSAGAAKSASNIPPTFAAPVATDAPKSVVGDAVQAGDLTPVEGLPAKKTVQDIYQEGLENLKASKFDEAAQSFSMILKDYPDDKLAGNAQYWLGESYYGKGDFQRAAVAFAAGYQNYKDSPKRADSLLKLGVSMKALKKDTEACAAFKSLPKEFPKADQALKDRAKKESIALKCK